MSLPYVSDAPLAIIGAGRVGTSLGLLLNRAGHRITACAARSSKTLDVAVRLLGSQGTTKLSEAVSGAEIVMISVPDDAVDGVARELAPHMDEGTFVFHTAGSKGVAPLAPLEEVGANVAAIHPLQAIPSTEAGLERIPGSFFGVTTSHLDWATGLVEAVGGRVLEVPESERTLYHACAAIASNYMVTLAMLIEGSGRDVEPYLPLMQGTLDNLRNLAPSKAMTGPLVRGDSGTLGRHLEVLGEEASSAYRAIGGTAIRLLTDAGRISPQDAQKLSEALGEGD